MIVTTSDFGRKQSVERDGNSMGLLFLMLAGVGITPAKPITANDWLGQVTYPAGAKQRGEEGVTFFDVLLSPQGKPVNCTVTRSSGSSELDDASCQMASKRLRMKPALDELGQPIHALIHSHLQWSLGSRWAVKRPPDLVIDVNRLPNRASEISVALNVKTDVTGRIVACFPALLAETLSELDTVACSQAGATLKGVVKDASGNAVAAAQTINVSFKTPPP